MFLLKRLRRLSLAAAALFGVAQFAATAQSALLVYDPFRIGVGGDAYLAGDDAIGINELGGQNPATGPTAFYAGPWIQPGGDSQAVKGVGSYIYPFFPSAGDRVDDAVHSSCCTRGRTGREIAGGLGGGPDPRTIYQSFLIDFGNQGTDDPTFFGIRAYEMWNGGVGDDYLAVELFVNSFNDVNDFTLAVRTPSSTASAQLDGGGRTLANMAGVHLVVMKFGFDPVLPDEISVYLDPTDSIESNWIPSAVVSAPNSDLFISHHGAMTNFIFSGSGHVPAGFDELRWGDTFADVTPFVPDISGVLVSNLAEPVRDNTPIANPEFWAAQSFVSDDHHHSLSSIEAIVGNSLDAPQVVAELRKADVNNEIDLTAEGLLTTFTFDDLSEGSPAAHLFSPDNSVNLAPNTRYWFVLGSANEGTFDWSYAEGGNFIGPGTLSDFADSSDAGTTWNYGGGPFNPYLIQVKVAEYILPGDYNQNGIVDAADYTVWRDTQGAMGEGLVADGDGNGTIDDGDYDVWKAHFAEVSPETGAGSDSGSALSPHAIPEPATSMLLALAATSVTLLWRRRD
jgi:hypothetical protein